MLKIEADKYFSPRVILSLSILVGFLIFTILIITFLGRQIGDKADRIREQRAVIEGRISSISRLAELTASAKEAQPALLELQSLLPKRDELVGFPRYVDSLAGKHSLISRFEFRGEEKAPTEDQAGTSSFYLSIDGTYRNILSFIDEFEEGQFIVKIDSFDVVLQRESTNFKAEMNGLIYFRD
ncbi:MAG: hypothetical protein WD883_00245 [Candidatus Colwellbacteria bacterium]